MELKINLLQIKHAKRRLWLGIGSFVFVALLLAIEYVNVDDYDPTEVIISIYFIFIGVIHLYESQGISANQLIGKAYLHLDDEKITYKPKLFKPEKLIYCDKLEYIEDKSNRLCLVDRSGTKTILDLSNYSYDLVREIRDSVYRLVEEKKIEVRNSIRK
jgi:uncharacterized membrane protein